MPDPAQSLECWMPDSGVLESMKKINKLGVEHMILRLKALIFQALNIPNSQREWDLLFSQDGIEKNITVTFDLGTTTSYLLHLFLISNYAYYIKKK